MWCIVWSSRCIYISQQHRPVVCIHTRHKGNRSPTTFTIPSLVPAATCEWGALCAGTSVGGSCDVVGSFICGTCQCDAQKCEFHLWDCSSENIWLDGHQQPNIWLQTYQSSSKEGGSVPLQTTYAYYIYICVCILNGREAVPTICMYEL
jgi:hypothetical protein